MNMIMAMVTAFIASYYGASTVYDGVNEVVVNRCDYFNRNVYLVMLHQRMAAGLAGLTGIMLIEMILFVIREMKSN